MHISLNKTAANPLFTPPVGALWGNLRSSKNGANVKTMRIGILGAFALTLFSCHGERLPTVTLETDKGNIVIELYPEAAPATVANFAKLIEAEFYNGLKFHRYVPGFVIQGGDPDGTGRGGPGWTIRGEFQDPGLREKMPPHEKGVLAMARVTLIPPAVNFTSAWEPMRRGMRISMGTTPRLEESSKGWMSWMRCAKAMSCAK